MREVYERVRDLMLSLGKIPLRAHLHRQRVTRYHIAVLREIASTDSNVRVIRNARNFGHVRSPMHAILQARGDAVIVLMSDLQDPPEVLAQLLEEWETRNSDRDCGQAPEPRGRADVSDPEAVLPADQPPLGRH